MGSISLVACHCDQAKLVAIHKYLAAHFPDFVLRDFHAPTRLMQAGLAGPYDADAHHVVSLTHTDVLTYYAVLLREFLAKDSWQGAFCSDW